MSPTADEMPETSPIVQTSKKTIKFVQSSTKVDGFEIVIGDLKVSVNIVKLQDTLYLWIGRDADPDINDLSLAMNHQNRTETLSANILGSNTDSISMQLASRLVKKLKQQVYVSCNIQLDRFSLPLLERGIVVGIQNKADIL